ncbi:MAG: tRNA uridine-5-carboxymethylaminomethyl(34) synthesis GTPase MnmE [Bacteroidetes bacterium]|nr:tRNA uridine-5-carboxymethylaminomethyl(34) synthesis GTPase MnmE [Bacteroidota bacterium]
MHPTHHTRETIAAVATAVGIGGIAVIRISGDHAVSSADALFRGTTRVKDAASHTVHYGTIVDPVSRETIDTVLVTVFRDPHSFTGEDVVEISCHGGYFVAQRILTLLYNNGALPAQPGEFTLRAFLNGKLDLAQAEAVADIISSTTEKSHKASVDLLTGKLSSAVRALRQEILDICSLLELELDFSQEGIELADRRSVVTKLNAIQQSITSLSDSYREGRVIREGIKVALVGRPNAGKSSLLNALLKEERAIVSDIPGTTRDTIEERVVLDGIEFIFHDTAGLRESSDSIEIEGMKRTSKAIAGADVVLFLIDGSAEHSAADHLRYKEIADTYAGSKRPLWVLNKYDIRHGSETFRTMENALWISCKTHHGLAELKQELVRISIPTHDPASSSVTITNIRHKDALERARVSISTAAEAIEGGLGGDFAAVDLRAAMNYLGEIIGLTTPDDILNNIFSNFCIGK